MDKMMMRAKKKFDRLDVDGNGVLEGEELIGLAEWVWSRFHPGGETLSEDLKAEHGAKLLGRLDANGDGMVTMEEWKGLFQVVEAELGAEKARFFLEYLEGGAKQLPVVEDDGAMAAKDAEQQWKEALEAFSES